jgi:hypothetical protein
MPIKLGTLPRRSSNVCAFTAPFLSLNGVHGNSERQSSMVVESSAKAVCFIATEKLSQA